MIQSMLQFEPSGVWTIPSNALLVSLVSTVKSCREKCDTAIQHLEILRSSKGSTKDFSNPLKNLQDNIEVLNRGAASFKEIELGDLDRQAIVALLVELSVGVRDFKSLLFDSADQVLVDQLLVELNNAVGEVPSLHEATKNGYEEIVALLIDKGAKVDDVDEDSAQPLHRAAEYGHIKVMEILLNKGAKVDAADKNGWQPLHWAAFNGRIRAIEILLSKGADKNATENRGRVPWHMAALGGQEEEVILLLS